MKQYGYESLQNNLQGQENLLLCFFLNLENLSLHYCGSAGYETFQKYKRQTTTKKYNIVTMCKEQSQTINSYKVYPRDKHFCLNSILTFRGLCSTFCPLIFSKEI